MKDIIHFKNGKWFVPATVDPTKPFTLEMFGGVAGGADCTKAWKSAQKFAGGRK